jgi:hypothetical protein
MRTLDRLLLEHFAAVKLKQRQFSALESRFYLRVTGPFMQKKKIDQSKRMVPETLFQQSKRA